MFSPQVRLCNWTRKVQRKTRKQQQSNSPQQDNRCSLRNSENNEEKRLFVTEKQIKQ